MEFFLTVSSVVGYFVNAFGIAFNFLDVHVQVIALFCYMLHHALFSLKMISFYNRNGLGSDKV